MSTQPTTTEPGNRPRFVVGDARLQAVFMHRADVCATIDEYAAAAGMSVDVVLDLLGDVLDVGALSLEVAGDEMFIHTAPLGRPTPRHLPEIDANLWERLRLRNGPERAADLWKLVRSMERAGWKTDTHPARLAFGLGTGPTPPDVGVVVGSNLVPVLPFLTDGQLADPRGPLTSFDLAGAAAVAVCCTEGELDQFVTAVRVWIGQRQLPAAMSVILLEAPAWQPTILTPRDAAVVPVSMTKALLDEQGLPAPRP